MGEGHYGLVGLIMMVKDVLPGVVLILEPRHLDAATCRPQGLHTRHVMNPVLLRGGHFHGPRLRP